MRRRHRARQLLRTIVFLRIRLSKRLLFSKGQVARQRQPRAIRTAGEDREGVTQLCTITELVLHRGYRVMMISCKVGLWIG